MKTFWLLFTVMFVTYVLGISLPILTLEKVFGIFNNEQSILSGLGTLIDHEEYILFAIIGLFSILFPILKFTSMAIIAVKWTRTGVACKKWLEVLEKAGRWSMLDVFVVALVVVFVKLGTLANVEPRYGVIFFTISVIVAILTSECLGRIICTELEPDGVLPGYESSLPVKTVFSFTVLTIITAGFCMLAASYHIVKTTDGTKFYFKKEIAFNHTYVDIDAVPFSELKSYTDVIKVMIYCGDVKYIPNPVSLLADGAVEFCDEFSLTESVDEIGRASKAQIDDFNTTISTNAVKAKEAMSNQADNQWAGREC